jgi:hypothetical protein
MRRSVGECGRRLSVVSSLLLACGGSATTSEDADVDTRGSTGAAEGTDGTEGEGPGDTETGESSGGPAETTTTVELRVKDFNVPTAETYYACFEFTFDIDKLAHIVGFEAKIDNVPHVHHYVLTRLDEPTGNTNGYSCLDVRGDFVWSWAPGQDEFWMPEEAGFLIGDEPGGRVTFRLQVHYNNPLGVAGEIDSSGVDLHITDQLRANDAGTIVFADILGFSIPPGEPAYEHVMRCRSEATAGFMDGPIRVFGTSMHAHEIGSVLWTEQWRDGQFVQEVNRDEPFLFDSQHMKFVDIEIQPGDEIVNHCIYDSSERTTTTYGGPGTGDEMCWNSMVYYPKMSSGVSFCSSSS